MRTLFLRSAIAILCITCLLKLFAVLSDFTWLSTKDPVLGFLTRRQTLFLATAIEAAVIARLLQRAAAQQHAYTLAWAATVFAIYRFGFESIAADTWCGCLGMAEDWLHLKPATADLLSFILLGYLLIGAYAFSYLQFRDIDCRGHESRNKQLTVVGHGAKPK